MRFGLDLPPQFRVFGGFFVYPFGMGSLPDIRRTIRAALLARMSFIPLAVLSPVFAGALGRRSVSHEVPA